MTAKEFSDSLRLIADFYDEHPDFNIPSMESVSFFCEGMDELKKVGEAFGSCDWRSNPPFYEVNKMFGRIRLCAYDYQNKVCKKTVVGTKMVKKCVSKGYEEKEVEEDIVEWECPDHIKVIENGKA